MLTLPEPARCQRLRDPACRALLREEWENPAKRAVSFGWDGLEVEAVANPEHEKWLGRSIEELAAERGADPLDTFLDLALEEELETQFQTRMNDVARQFIEHVVRTALCDPIVMPGSSDGGAHLASFTVPTTPREC